jgi:hypothetical protein
LPLEKLWMSQLVWEKSSQAARNTELMETP